MLGSLWFGVLEALESCFHIAWHREITGSVDIIPFEFDATIEFGLPILGDLVLGFEHGCKMFGVLFAHILGCEVVHHETERDWASFVCEQAMGVGILDVSVACEVLNQLIICESAGLG